MADGNVDYTYVEANTNGHLLSLLKRFQDYYHTTGVHDCRALEAVLGKNSHVDKLVRVCSEEKGGDIIFTRTCTPYSRVSKDKPSKPSTSEQPTKSKSIVPPSKPIHSVSKGALQQQPRAHAGSVKSVDRRTDQKAK